MMRFQPTTKAMQIAFVVTFAICQSPRVSAQFGNCVFDSVKGENVCIWLSSPVAITDATTGRDIVLGEYSNLYAICDADSTSFSVSNCECLLTVQASLSDSYDPSDNCNSCRYSSLTVNSFAMQYDCSNVLVGDCVALDSNGCQSNEVNPTPFPVESPTDFPVESPTDFPIKSPTEPASSQGDDDDDDDDEEEEEEEEEDNDSNASPIRSPSTQSPESGEPDTSTSASERSVTSSGFVVNPTNVIGIIMLSLVLPQSW